MTEKIIKGEFDKLKDRLSNLAASELCDYGSIHDSEYRIKGFKKCAKWMQEEFLKDLWHPTNEEPREFTEVLAEAKITESIKTYISFKRNNALFKNWDTNITCWLYIDDLLPKEGGKQ